MRRGKVVGHNKKPVQHVRRDRPTHACWHDDGSVSIVHGDADGYEPGDLVKLPRGYSDETHEADPATKSFKLRAAPPASGRSVDDRLRALEEVVALLKSKLAESADGKDE